MPTAGEPRQSDFRVWHEIPEFRARHQIRPKRALAPFFTTPFVLLALAGASFAQEPRAPAPTPCNVVTGSLEVNAEGELVRPPVTPEDCVAAEDLIKKFLTMSRGDFRGVDIIEGVPGNVRVHIGRMTPWGGSADELPYNRRHGKTWLSERIVVVVMESSDFAGPKTTVVIADIETLQVCEFEPWPGADDPRTLSVQEIQDVLDRRRIGERPAPACRLSQLPIEQLLID